MIQAKFNDLHYLPVVTTLCIGLGLSAIATVTIRNWEKTKAQTQFERQADNLINHLQQKLDAYSRATRFFGGLYSVAENIDQEEFHRFSRRILPYNRSILANSL